MIPETAIQAALQAWSVERTSHPRQTLGPPMTAALEAALPHLEAVLRKQIAEEEQQAFSQAARRRSAEVITARIVEEGAFHCCAHPKCPGGSICCCQDAEEGNTK